MGRTPDGTRQGTERGDATASEPAIGVVGPQDLVERIIIMGRDSPAVPLRLVSAAYRDNHEIADKVGRLRGNVDACLFAGPAPYNSARKSGLLTMPATYVPFNGAALHSTLLRAALDERYDPTRVSIDALSRSDVERAYREVGLPTARVHLREEATGPGTFAAFHERLWRRGTTTVALTCMHTTAERLTAAGVPTLRIHPGGAAIRAALHTAVLLGEQRRLQECQLVVALIEVPTLRETTRRVMPRYWRDELKLALHRVLLAEAHRMNCAVWPLDDHSYLMTATRGSTAAATEDFHTPPFVQRVGAELGLTIEVGVGLGRTAQEAEGHARAALVRSRTNRRGFTLDRDGRAVLPTPRSVQRGRASKQPKGTEILARLVDGLAADDRPLVVDAMSAGKVLGLTPRTARRLLRVLVDEGLAWPLPLNRASRPGRPPQEYRLIVEKLHQDA